MEESMKVTRSSAVKIQLLQTEYKEITQYEAKSKLPPGSYLLGRMLYLCKPVGKGHTQTSREDASKTVAGEVRMDWISKNVYPKTNRAVAENIKDDYDTLLALSKYQRSASKKDRSSKWNEKAAKFNEAMNSHAYDIRTKSMDTQRNLEAETGVKMTENDEKFYFDNCYGAYVAICTPTVPQDWVKKKKRVQTRMESEERKKQKVQTEGKELSSTCSYFESDSDDTDHAADNMFEPLMEMSRTPQPSSIQTRGHPIRASSTTEPQVTSFPDVQVRTGRRSLNETLMRCIVQCLSEFKVSHSDVAGIMVRTANMVFGQKWSLPSHDSTEVENDDTDGDDNENMDVPRTRKRRSTADLTYVFPSQQCVSMYLEDAYLLNLKLVADYLINKDENIVTVGLDDTTKAAGYKLYDIKADHISVRGPEEKKTFTTGFSENKSHSGEDSAENYEHKLKILSVLGECTLDEMKNNVDFWMTDRAGDNETFRANMGIAESKTLKCCAHLILGVDNACDKVFREVEQRIGVQNLISVSAGDKAFCSSSSSIHTLGEIAISKLLSPSHAAHSVSLYSEFIEWLEDEGEQRHGFTGFTSNRFGRIAEIANQFLKMKDQIFRFFDAVVDINCNKLVLAVSAYIQSQWFGLCCELYGKIGEVVIFPLMDFLGIDKRGQNLKSERDWSGVKDFFRVKIPEMERLAESFKSGNGKDRLYAAMLREAVEALRRQLSAMPYFHDILGLGTATDEQLPDPDKLRYAPLSNLGCESEFAWFDNRVKVSGGSESVQSISRKKVICTNGLLVNSTFLDLNDEERANQWRWARTSESTSEVRKLEKDFLATVKMSKRLLLAKKEELKRKKNLKLLKTIGTCQKHGGPLTEGNLELLNKLSESELLSEVLYLRLTIAPNIRQKRRIADNKGQFRIERFSKDELRTSIRNAIKPEDGAEKDVEGLLMRIL